MLKVSQVVTRLSGDRSRTKSAIGYYIWPRVRTKNTVILLSRSFWVLHIIIVPIREPAIDRCTHTIRHFFLLDCTRRRRVRVLTRAERTRFITSIKKKRRRRRRWRDKPRHKSVSRSKILSIFIVPDNYRVPDLNGLQTLSNTLWKIAENVAILLSFHRENALNTVFTIRFNYNPRGDFFYSRCCCCCCCYDDDFRFSGERVSSRKGLFD